MKRPLRVLLVEDSEDDALLLRRELRRGDYVLEDLRVETRAEMWEALATSEWDLVVSDYGLPKFSAPLAMETLRESGRDIPLIIVSGTVNEEVAVKCLKGGASDFINKRNLARLLPAVARELREAGVRRERAAATRALRESEDRHRLFFMVSPLPILVTDTESRAIMDVNDAAIEHYGHSRAQFMQMRVNDLWPPGEDAVANDRAMAALGPGLTRLSSRHQRRDGSIMDVEIATHTLVLGERSARLAVVNDVTERRAFEGRLQQAQKMEAVGQLAGGVAHDFNNLLAVITSYAELLADEIPKGDPKRDDLDEIRRAALSAAGLTRQLLAFSRRQLLQPVVVALNGVIEQLEKMLRRVIGENISMETHLAPDLGAVKADPTQLEQILLNLVVNARDAMPAGGKLAIETANLVVNAGLSGLPAELAAGEYVSFSVSDDGVGMDEATQARIFEPFFTTKGLGQGTGLGLATVYGIVQQSGGHVSLASAPGKGSTFTVHLPRIYERETRPPTPVPGVVGRATETVLVVEDDHALRQVTGRVLRGAGYQVLDAANADDAVDLLTRSASIDILLTDVMMPLRSGPALAEELRKGQPGLRVLFMSGYAGEALTRQGLPLGAVMIEKPFTPEILKRKLREVLDQTGGTK